MWLILAESDILSDHADSLGSDVQERGEVLQGKMIFFPNFCSIVSGYLAAKLLNFQRKRS